VAPGAPVGALHGVALSLKSCIDVAGWPCPGGSLLRKDYVSKQDAPLVSRLKSAGAILLGNTNTPEFLMAYETNNLLSGRTSNPWNLAHSSGGSSGGEAAAIAAGCSAGGDRGFAIEPFRLHGLDRALDLWWFFFGPVIGNLIQHSIAGQEDQISPMLREYLAFATSGNPISLEKFMKACAERDLLRAEILRQMQDTRIL